MASTMHATKPNAAMRPMRVAIGLAGLQLGGCQLNALDLAGSLRRQGHSVITFCVEDSPQVSVIPVAERMGLSVRLIPPSSGGWGAARSVARMVREERVEVVHSYAPWLARPLTLALWRQPRVAIVITNWSMVHFPGIPRRVPLIVGTQQLQETGSSLRPGPVWLMEPPVDTEKDFPSAQLGSQLRSQLGVGQDEELVVVISRLDRDMKAEGVSNAMRAMEHLRSRKLRLVVVGDGDAGHLLRKLAGEVNQRVGRDVVLMPGVMHDPRPAYDAADLVLGMGGAALRGLAFTKPVIVLGEDGFSLPFKPTTAPYFMRHGFYGRGAEGDAVQLLAENIADVLEPSKRTQLKRFGRYCIDSRFSLNAKTSDLIGMYVQAKAAATTGNRIRDAWYTVSHTVGRIVRARMSDAVRKSLRRDCASASAPSTLQGVQLR